jgi:hypothetical protein
MKLIRSLTIVLTVAALGACAAAQPEKPSQRLLDYQAAAGEPVNSFRYFSLWSWEALDRTHLAIYTRGNQAYLLTVDGGCQNLAWVNTIAITSHTNEVSARFDKVLTGRFVPCLILEIRPVDLGKLKAEERLQKERAIQVKET